MIPVAGIVAGLLAAGAFGNQQQSGPDPDFWSVLGAIVFAVMILVFGALVVQGHVVALPFLLASVVAFQPWLVTRLVLIPLGRPKLAYFVARMSIWHWGGDSRGGALVAATLAAVRRPDPKIWAWIEAKRNAGKELKAGGLLASAIAFDLRGEAERARQTLSAFAEFDKDSCCRTARQLAFEWLAAEAADRGDWWMAAGWGLHPRGAGAGATLIGRIASRVGGDPWRPSMPLRFVSNAHLWWAWFWSFRWRALRPLVRWACAKPLEPSGAAGSAKPVRPVVAGAAHDRALVLQAWAAADPKRLEAQDVSALGDAWDEALDRSAVEEWSTRATELGAGGDVLVGLRSTVATELAQLLQDSGCDIGGMADDAKCPAMLRDAALQLRGAYLEELEAAADGLLARVEDGIELAAADEWNEFQMVARLYARAHEKAGAYNRASAFQAAHHPLCSLAVWLWNERCEYTVAHAIFRFLLAEAIAVDDAEAIQLQTDNVACRRG